MDKHALSVAKCHEIEHVLSEVYDSVVQEEEQNGIVETDYS